MQKKIIVTITLLVCLTVIVSFSLLIEKDNDISLFENTNISDDVYLYIGVQNLECLFYNLTDFMNIKEYNNLEYEGTIRGLIVPHHLLARDLIHEAFQIAHNTKYKTIVVFGPDHESADMGKVFTSTSNWQTPMGILDADKEAVESILRLDFVLENNKKMTNEHSISGLVPFIEYYFSDAKIIPIALTKQLTLENLDKLIYTLKDNIKIDDTLFISSVDFSHYRSLEKSNEMDKISIDAILNKDLVKIMSFTNDNLDSPNSIAAMIKAMDIIGANNIKLINNSNSQIILDKKIDETTSYITFMFYDKNNNNGG